MPQSSWPPPPLDDSATPDEAVAWLGRFFSHPETIRRNRNVKPRRYHNLVQHEDGSIEFVRTETGLALEAAFAEVFGPQPEEPDVEF